MFRRILSASFLFLFIFSVVTLETAFAQEIQGLNIGYVEPQAILSKMPEMKAVQQRLQNFAERKQEELVQKQQDFEQQVSEYQQKESVISDAAREKEEERLGQLNAELQEYRTQLQQEIQQKQQELVGPLLDQISNAIDSVADRMGLTYVLNTATSNGDVIILYASDEARQKYDITDEVMDELDM